MNDNYVPEGAYAVLLKIGGALITLRGTIFFLSSLALIYSYGHSGTIGNYQTAFFWVFLFFAFSLALGLKLIGVRFSSNRTVFLEKQQSLNPSTPGSLEYKKKIPAPLTTPEKTFLRPTTVLVCLLIDFGAAIALELSLDALPKLYFVLVFEFILISFTILEIAKNH